MKQLDLIKRFRTTIVVAMLFAAIGFINGCSDSSTDTTEKTDSTTNVMSDTSNLQTDTIPVDTTKGDQLPPPR